MTTSDGASLLRALGGPAHGRDANAASAVGADGAFSRLLGAAQRGQVSTGRPVELAPGLAIELSDGQMSRLREAADRAAAAGAQQALVLMDGRLLKLDVAARRVTQEVQLEHGDVVGRIDAFINASAPDPEREAAVRSLVSGLARGGPPPGLSRALADPTG